MHVKPGYIANNQAQRRFDFNGHLVVASPSPDEINALAIMTRQGLCTELAPGLARAIALACNPISATRAAELAELLIRMRADTVS